MRELFRYAKGKHRGGAEVFIVVKRAFRLTTGRITGSSLYQRKRIKGNRHAVDTPYNQTYITDDLYLSCDRTRHYNEIQFLVSENTIIT